jgi:hypothetical protein
MSTGNIYLNQNAPKKPAHEGETVGDSLTGHDKPMEEVHPGAPAALVFASYPVFLGIAIVLMILIVWLMY